MGEPGGGGEPVELAGGDVGQGPADGEGVVVAVGGAEGDEAVQGARQDAVGAGGGAEAEAGGELGGVDRRAGVGRGLAGEVLVGPGGGGSKDREPDVFDVGAAGSVPEPVEQRVFPGGDDEPGRGGLVVGAVHSATPGSASMPAVGAGVGWWRRPSRYH